LSLTAQQQQKGKGYNIPLHQLTLSTLQYLIISDATEGLVHLLPGIYAIVKSAVIVKTLGRGTAAELSGFLQRSSLDATQQQPTARNVPLACCSYYLGNSSGPETDCPTTTISTFSTNSSNSNGSTGHSKTG